MAIANLIIFKEKYDKWIEQIMTSIYLIFCTVHGGLHEINQIGALSHIMGYEELHGVTSVSVILGIERVVQLFNSEFSIHTNDGIAPPCESHI